MLRAISALFDIRPHEWPRVLLLYGLGGLFLVGMTWGETICEALFLKQVGVQFLSYTFIADAIIGIVTIAIYTAFVDRIANDKLAIGIFVIFVMLIVSGRLLISAGQGAPAYLYLYLLSHIVRDLFVLHWWTFVISLYDTRAAKRVAPFLSTAARPAGAIAGLSMPLLNSFVAPENIILLWAGVIGLVAVGLYFMPLILKDLPALTAINPKAARSSYIQNMQEGAKYVGQSAFLRWMALSTLVMTILFALVNYQTSRILVSQLGSVKAVSEFTGALTGWTNLILLPIQLFVLSRIVSRFGLGNANMIFPIGTLGIAGLLAAFPNIITAGAAYFNRTTFRTGFRITLDNLFYNAVPLRVKGRARAFIGGLVVPLGTLIGGSTLLVLPFIPEAAAYLPIVIVGLALAYAVSVLIIRQRYTRALITMLQQEDYSSLLDASGEISAPDQATLNFLIDGLRESRNSELSVFLAKLIADVGGKQTIPMLAQTARSGPPQIRAAILDSFVAADFRGDEVRALFNECLHDADPQVRQAAISGLRQTAQNSDQFLPLALDLARDPSPAVRVEVLPPLVRSGDLYYMASAIQALGPILADTDPHLRARGVEILGQAADPRFIRNLIDYLTDPEDEIRLEAATAIERLAERGIPRELSAALPAHFTPLLTDPVERIRQAALSVLGRLNTPDTQRILLTSLDDPSPEIRDAAVRALARLGKPALPLLDQGLRSPSPMTRRMATVALSRIDREKAAELIRGFVTHNLTQAYANHVRMIALADCAGYRSVGILQSLLRERNHDLMVEIFYLLGALHDVQTVGVIAESLESSEGRTRANALEALESLSTPQIARLMGPLFDREISEANLLKVSLDASGLPKQPRVVIQAMASDNADPWLRAVTIVALGEIGTSAFELAMNKAQALISTESEADAAKEAEKGAPEGKDADKTAAAPKEAEEPELRSRNRRSRSSIDLLGAITGEARIEKDPDAPKGEQLKSERVIQDRKTSRIPTAGAEGGRSGPGSGPISTPISTPNPCQSLFTRDELTALFNAAQQSDAAEVQVAAQSALRLLSGQSVSEIFQSQGGIMLSAIEKIIFLKEVTFFEGMSVDQLKILASVAEEQVYDEDQVIFSEGEPGGALYVVVRGRVAIEREGGARKGSMLRIATVQAYSYFGEMTLFDNSPRTERALAIQDTLVLRLRREPLIALTRQYPELSLRLINVLSARLREANDRIAQLTTAKPRELHKVFDKLG